MAYTDAQLAGFLRRCRAANRERETAPIEASEANLKCTPKTVSAEQMERLDAAIKQQQIECKKGGWRGAAKWLEENFPEDFKEPIAAPLAQPSCGTGSSISCPNSEPLNQTPTVERQPLPNTSESPQSVPAALPAPSPIPPLSNAFWQALLFGNPDSLVSSSDATRAIALVSNKLGVRVADGETVSPMRAGQLRRLFRDRFGPADAEQTTAALWRSAPASPGAPQPSDQSQLPPGPLPIRRSQPRWIRELNEAGGAEREWLTENRLWCG
jgi:hypothetical protein